MHLEFGSQQLILGIRASVISIRNLQQIPFELVAVLLCASAALAGGKLGQELALELLEAGGHPGGNARLLRQLTVIGLIRASADKVFAFEADQSSITLHESGKILGRQLIGDRPHQRIQSAADCCNRS
ncbi:hypothetical protein D3C73_715960 [compost metagenome]